MTRKLTPEEKSAREAERASHKALLERNLASDMQYIKSVPRELPADRVLVHNFVRPDMILGTNGFRAWTQKLDGTIEPCACNWEMANRAGHAHYRVKLSPSWKRALSRRR
jgi:hypothetical protein